MVWEAVETHAAIDKAIYLDQGRRFRGFLKEHIMDVDDAYDDHIRDRFRSHMGVSTSGRACPREIWYNWRWAIVSKFSGRMLRLFNRGHLEEARFTAMLRTIDVQVWQSENGQQYRVSMYGGHYGSAIDGVALGIPELPNIPVLLEMKTHNNKSFVKLAGEKNREGDYLTMPAGVQKAKLEHYVQMQQYMKYFKLTHGLYCAVNKDTDELWFEIIEYDAACAEHFIERSGRIIFTKEAPPKISENENFWTCKYCDKRRICHFGATPDLNCRTCAAAQPLEDGTWFCSTHSAILDKERQLTACPEWQVHPSLDSTRH